MILFEKNKIRKGDIVILLIALLLIALAFLLRGVLRANADGALPRVDIYVQDELYRSVELREGREEIVVIEQENGERNELHISGEGVWMHSSSCKNQDCVEQGRVGADNYESRALGSFIICLPHKLAVEFVPNA